MRKILKKLFLVCFILSIYANVQAQDVEGKKEEIQKELKAKKVSEDQIKTRLKQKGIDLDNLNPEQLPTLEAEINKTITELEQEKQTNIGAVNDIQTDIAESLDSLTEEKVNQELIESVDDITEKMDEGASLEEALADDFAERMASRYKNTNSIYGHSLFFNNEIDFITTTRSVTTPAGYILDVGDKVAINIFGVSQADLLYEIEEDGFIRPSGIYKIYLKGVSLGKAKILLRNRFKQSYVFSEGQFNVELHTARTINVNMFGEVNQPGSYTISALNTALNALVAAGGITSSASVRTIKIISGGKERVVDLYEFINDPQTIHNYYLKENDIIYVPKSNKVVWARGAGFKTSARFELLPNENFETLLKLSGGLKSAAYTDVIQYLSYDGEEQILTNFSYTDFVSSNVYLADRDEIRIKTSSIEFKNFFETTGAIRHPGIYELKSGYKVSDAIKISRIEDNTYAKIGYLRRSNNDGTYKLIRLQLEEIISDTGSGFNIPLKNRDVLSFYGKADYVDNYSFSIQGAVRKSGDYFYDPDGTITLYDAIMKSKGLKASATDFGYIIGQPVDNSLERNYKIINLRDAMNNPSSEANITINANDRIVIPSKQSYSEQHTVSIGGAVRNPGEYVFDSTLSVREMLVMAGGLKLEAASNKVDVFRLSINENSPTRTFATSILLNHNLDPFNSSDTLILKPFDKIVVRNTPEFEPMQLVQLNGEVRYPGQYAILGENETVSSLIERAGGFTNEALPEAATFIRNQDNIGRIVTRLDKAVKRKNHHDIKIKNQDVITIPKIVDIVTLDKKGTRIEEVTLLKDYTGPELKIAVNYNNKRAGWYVRKYAGGFDRAAAKRKTIVVHPNGEVKRTVNLLLFKIYPKVRRDSEIKLTLRKKEVKQGIIDPKPEKEKMTVAERLMTLQALVAVVSGTTTTAITTLLLIRQL